MYAFRERYAKERGLDFRRVDTPTLETIDPGLPSAVGKSANP